MSRKASREPSQVTNEKGEVLQDGPEGVAVSFEPGAAVETGHRLIDNGLQAERERDPD